MSVEAIDIQARSLSLGLAAALIAGCTAKPDYKTYEDCILAEVTANQSQAAVVVIRDACRTKFPPPPPTDEDLARAAADAAAATGDAAAADAAQAAADVAAAAADAAAAAADNTTNSSK